jgi:hypothetical protein
VTDISGKQLALRVQGLIHGQFGGDLTRAARELGVDETELRRIVVSASESPRLDVLAAIVRELGVDACWLMTGEYDWDAHRRQLELADEDGDDTGAAPVVRALARLRDPDRIRRVG